MEKGRSIKVFILLLMAILSSILTILDYVIVDPVPFIDEIGFSGVTAALWGYYMVAIKKSKNNNQKHLDK